MIKIYRSPLRKSSFFSIQRKKGFSCWMGFFRLSTDCKSLNSHDKPSSCIMQRICWWIPQISLPKHQNTMHFLPRDFWMGARPQRLVLVLPSMIFWTAWFRLQVWLCIKFLSLTHIGRVCLTRPILRILHPRPRDIASACTMHGYGDQVLQLGCKPYPLS